MSFGKIFNFVIDKENLTVTVERSFDAPVELVWRAWTEADLLARWWAPRPWLAVTKEMDFRVGGRWLYAMTGPEGQKHWDLKVFLKIDPQRSFAYRSTFCDENGNVAPGTQGSTWENTFTEKDGGTLVTNVIRSESLEHLEAHIRMGFKEGYTMGLDQLEEVLGEMKKKN